MIRSTVFLSIVLFLCATARAQQALEGSAANLQKCLTDDDFDPELDYFPSKWEPSQYIPAATKLDPAGDGNFIEFNQDVTTDLFSISYHKYYKIITNHFVNQTYLLYLCGTEPPTEELEEGRHHLVLPIPHTGGVAVTETPQIPYLELLGLRNQIVGYIGDDQWVSSPCLNYMLDNNDYEAETVVNADDPYNATINQQLTQEFLDKHDNNVLIFGGPYFDPTANRTVIAAATQERTTVATFDWLGYYAAYFNLEDMSNQIVAETKARYDCSSANAERVSADQSAEDRTVVLWATYFEGYNWSVAECPSWDTTYYCEYAMHCGARILSRPEGLGWNNPEFGGRYWYLDDDQLLEVRSLTFLLFGR